VSRGTRLHAPVALTLVAAVHAMTVAPEISDALHDVRLVGSGELRFFGLPVYEARLWARPGFDPAHFERNPFALEIRYARRLPGNAIAERSIAEMRRIGDFSPEEGQRWLGIMREAFPDVADGDRLTGVNDGQGGVRFFHNGRAGPALQDARFAHLFFGIWLSERTPSRALRESLVAGATSVPTTAP